MSGAKAKLAPEGKGVLFAVFCAWMFVLMGRPQDFLWFLVPLRPALVMSGITVLVFLCGYSYLFRVTAFDNPQVKAFTALFFLMVIGVFFAYHRRVAFMFIFTVYLSNVVFFYACFLAVNSIREVRTTLFICCLAAGIYGAFSLTYGMVIEGRLTSGEMFDPNDLAYLLVSILPYNFLFLSSDHSLVKRIVCAANIPLTVTVILMTGSRGGFIGLSAVVILLLLRKTQTIRFSYKILLVLLGVAAIAYKGESIDFSRYKTLMNVEEDYNLTDEWGRKEVWKSGLLLIASNPLTGVGVNCFDMAIGEQRQKAGEIPLWQAPHNSWVQIGAETGIIGFVLFGVLIWRAFKAFRRAEKQTECLELRKVGEMAFVGFSGHFICSMFLSQGYSIYFVWYLSLSAVLHRLSGADGKAVS